LPITFKISEKVLLLGKYIISRRLFKKLKNKFLGLFNVVEAYYRGALRYYYRRYIARFL